MNKLLKTILIISIALFGTIFLFVGSAQAIEGLTIQFENGNNQPLFDEANFLPGESVSRQVEVINETGEIQEIATEAIIFPEFPNSNNVPTDDLSRVLEITISQGTTDLYGGSTGLKTLYNFYEVGETYLSNIGDGSTVQYDFTIYFPSEAGDDWQEKTTTYFDILVGAQGTEGGGTTGGGTSGGGGGGYVRGLTIFNEADINASTTSVTITWTTNYFSTSQVIYGAEGEQHTLDLSDASSTPPKYGYAHTSLEYDVSPKVTSHLVIITGLTPGETYYYRCVSHGSLAIGTEHSFTTLVGTGGEGETVGPIPPLSPGPTPSPGEEGEVPGEITEAPAGEGEEGIILGEKEEAPARFAPGQAHVDQDRDRIDLSTASADRRSR